VALVEAALLTALAVIFTFAGTYIPFLGFFLMIVAIPLSLVGIRHGQGILGMSVVVAGLLGIMIGGLPTGISVVLISGSAALFITYAYLHKWTTSHTVIGLSIISIITFSISFQLLLLVSGIDFFELMDTSMKQSIEMVKALPFESSQRDEMLKSMDLLVETTKIIFPSVLFVMGVVQALINVAVLQAVLKRLKMPFVKGRPFNQFSFDKSVLIGTTLILGLSYFAGTMGIVDLVTLVANVIIIIAFVFSIQGISVMDYFLSSRGAKPGMRVFFITLLYFLLNGYIFFGMVGWFDVIFNFRKLERSAH
jgi:uncharacterized protein YybS (DUF2232 family)